MHFLKSSQAKEHAWMASAPGIALFYLTAVLGPAIKSRPVQHLKLCAEVRADERRRQRTAQREKQK
ncbi:MAG TPA: hypothetical protein IAD32_02365 [Candidatus Scatavimonas merdigallinarum]|uniref:Uncharacterized protein n=1 Tax=Candidatus Scatavimonas merdigallinarum TaxID=2840914 RepID=A0A9D0ZIT3_9FIRM|nr:hypothetical protein [Candidatus Scatavimonas merdigallinarum]